MSDASYSFLDVVTLDGVRERFATGDALAVLSTDLEQLIWTNGPGAHLFGHADIEAAIGASSGLPFAVRRQISATSGYPAIGSGRTILVRLAGRPVGFTAGQITMPDGELAILLALPATNANDNAADALSGFGGAGQFVAFVDAAGTIDEASPGFAALGIDANTLAPMLSKLRTGQARIAKRMLPGATHAMPAGLAELTDTRYLLVVVDDSPQAVDGSDETDEAPPATEARQEYRANEETVDKAAADQVAADGDPDHDSWYFSAPAESPSSVTAMEPEQPAAEDVAGDDDAGEGVSRPTDEPALIEAEPSLNPDEANETPGTSTASPDEGFEPQDTDETVEAGGSEPAVLAGEESASAGEEPDDSAPAEPRTAAPPVHATGPVRFVWRTDAEGRFSQMSPEFADAVGAEAADIVGRRFEDVAKAFGLDPSGEIAGLLARRDTWSGRSVLWPVAGTDLKLPVDLAALPVYGRTRTFEGFRGFGVARGGDAQVDPEALGLSIAAALEKATEADAAEAPAAHIEPASDAEPPADPFQGEVPALSIAPMPDRRFTDKVIRLAEHRQPANDKGLSTGERIAFEQIGERLKEAVTSESPPADAAEAAVEVSHPAEADDLHADRALSADNDVPAPTMAEDAEADEFLASVEAATSDLPVTSRDGDTHASEAAALDDAGLPMPMAEEAMPEANAAAELPTEDLADVDRISPDYDSAADDAPTAYLDAAEVVETPDDASTTELMGFDADPSAIEAGDPEPLERSRPEVAEAEIAPGEIASQGTDEPAADAPIAQMPSPRKSGRAGMSLLDFARWEDDAQPESPAPEIVTVEESAKHDGGDSDAVATVEDAAEPAAADDSEQKQAEIAGPVEAQEDGAPDDVYEADVQSAQPEPIGLSEPSENTHGASEPREAIEPETEAATYPAGELSENASGEPDAALVPQEVPTLDARSPAVDDSPANEPDYEVPPAYEAHGLADAQERSPGTAETDTTILERLPVSVLVHAGDALHYANAEFLALTGYESLEHLAGAGGIGALFVDRYGESESTERSDRQMMLRTADGEEFPVEAFLQSTPWKGGKALLLVLARASQGSFSAASGQSPLVAELEARVAEMRTIIDTATDGVVLMSRDGTIRSISRPAEALFGFDSDEVAGKPFSSLFAIESQRAARDYLAGLSDNGVASVLNDGREVIGREAQGRFIPLFMTIGKLPNESGYCAVVRDITQWKRAEEELTQARAVAERASSHKTDFLARVSHEIRTPLNAIIGFSELMVDEKFGPVANDRYRDYLRDINRSGNHVLDIVNDLLDISKIEAGQQEMSYEAVSLNDTLAETVAMMQPQANRERVIIRSSFASKLPEVVADLRSVRQIALNILSNAVRYTQAGGQVIVSTAYEASGDIVMRVRDTGIGMTAAEIEQALKPFKQINSLKRQRGDGTGLGLPLTKAMVEANRAKFVINSTPGEGTLVEITFPSTRVLAQ